MKQEILKEQAATMQKEASKIIAPLLSGLLSAAAMDSATQAVHGKKWGIPFYDGEWDAKRALMAVTNAGIGALIPKGLKPVPKGPKPNPAAVIGGSVGAMAGKDLMLSSMSLPGEASKYLQDAATAASSQAGQSAADTAAKNAIAEAIGNVGKALPWVFGVGGVGALGMGALALRKYLKSKDAEEKAKLKLTLPGSPEEPDTRAELEMPVDVPLLSDAMQSDIGRGARRMARKNIRANMRKQDPFTNKLIPLPMWQDKYGEEPLIDEVDQWRNGIEEQYGKKVKYASAPMPPAPPAGGPPPSPIATAPTPKGAVPMKQPVQGTPGPQLASRYTQAADPAQNLDKIRKDLELGAAKLRVRRECNQQPIA